jgi:hypothetical protein
MVWLCKNGSHFHWPSGKTKKGKGAMTSIPFKVKQLIEIRYYRNYSASV